MKKSGELTTQQLVGIIILIASFAVILFLLFRLNLGETSNKEICHNSVVLKSQSKISSGSLNCKTSYVCIGGNCEDFISSIDVSAKTKDEIIEAIQSEIKDCWWMFGEGKIDYVGYSWKIDYLVGTNCALCSVIKFGESVEDFEFNGELISSSERYLVVTGMRGENDYIESRLIKSENITDLKCDYFITKA